MRIFAILSGLTLIAVSGVAGLAATSMTGASLNLVVIGDSIPFASFCTECEHGFVDDYALRLESELGREVNVINRSRDDGAQLNQIADQVATEATLREQLASADMVIISAGFNDGPSWDASHPCGAELGDNARDDVDQMLTYTPACLDEEIAAREDDFGALFTAVETLVPDASPVVIVNAYNAWTGWSLFAAVAEPAELQQIDQSLAYFYDGWNAQECAVAAESGFACLDVYHAFNGPDGMAPAGDLLESDYTHPSRKGNALIADLLLEAHVLGVPPARPTAEGASATS